jgi:hypothetical protein
MSRRYRGGRLNRAWRNHRPETLERLSAERADDLFKVIVMLAQKFSNVGYPRCLPDLIGSGIALTELIDASTSHLI